MCVVALRRKLKSLDNYFLVFLVSLLISKSQYGLITGIIPSESSVFKSALKPLRLTFRTADGGKCKIIFKKGDDIRQDQLVVQMVSLMDRLIKSDYLDLHLTPYKVFATGQDEGMLEFVPSSSLAHVL